MKTFKTYSELKQLATFQERLNYLKMDGRVGDETFGVERYLNQEFYRSKLWKMTRFKVIARDLGCDLGIAGRGITYRPIIHHMNPITLWDIQHDIESVINQEFLITTMLDTHNTIHFGGANGDVPLWSERTKNDTILWKKR